MARSRIVSDWTDVFRDRPHDQRRGESFFLHEQYLNAQMVKVLKTIGYDRLYARAVGPYRH